MGPPASASVDVPEAGAYGRRHPGACPSDHRVTDHSSPLLLTWPSVPTGLRPGALDREKPPCARHSLEVVHSSVPELNPRAGHQVPHGAGNQNLSRCGDGRDPSGDVDSDTPHTMSALAQLDLRGMQSGADVDPESADRFLDRPGRADTAPRPIERGQDSVSGGFDEPSLEPGDWSRVISS